MGSQLGGGGGGAPSLPQFLTAFTLVTVAFPFGRGICLAMVGKLLGDSPQGAWMGLMFALGALARIAGPFWAVQGYSLFGAKAVFGSTAALFALALLAAVPLWRQLAPPNRSSGALGGAVASPLLERISTSSRHISQRSGVSTRSITRRGTSHPRYSHRRAQERGHPPQW